MKKNNLNIIIVFIMIYFIFRLNSIERSIDREILQIYREQNNLRHEIENIYLNVDEKLNKQASILDSYEVTFGEELNVDNLTVPVNISLIPKENTEKLTASLLISDEEYQMSKSGSTFTASLNIYVFNPFKIKVILNNEGTEKIETIDEYDNLDRKYLLEFYGEFLGDTKYSSGKYQYDGDIVINFSGYSNNSPEKVSISKYVNSEFIDEQEIDLRGNNSIMYSAKDEIKLSANDKIELYINVQDKYGLKYKYIVLYDEIDSNGKLVRMSPAWTSGSLVEIKDKNGKVLFENRK